MPKKNGAQLAAINYNKAVPHVYEELKDWLAERDVELVLAECKSEGEALAAAAAAEIFIAYKFQMTRKILTGLPNLRLLISSSIGYDHIDVQAATDCGIVVTNPATHCVEDVAEINLGLVLALARKLCILAKASGQGKWRPDIQPVHRFCNLTVGIVGFGKIGRAFAWRVKALGFKVLACSGSVPPEEIVKQGIEPVSYDELLRRSDFVSLHLALTDRTRHRLGVEQLKLMKPTAFVINTSRGGLIDEPALIKALQEGWISGAGLDVLETEPPDRNNALLTMDNVIVTAHSAANTAEAPQAWIDEWKQIIDEYLSGLWPINVLNPDVKPTAPLKKKT